jgi:hypothetical protein
MIADTRRCVYVPGYRIAHSTTRTAVLYIMYDTHHVQMYSSRYIIATVRIKDLENYFFHFFTFTFYFFDDPYVLYITYMYSSHTVV